MKDLTLTLDWVADAVGATRRQGSADAPVGDVVTDSRTIRPGDLFVALRGPRFDGHAFVGDVLARGAVGAIVEHGFAGSEEWTSAGSEEQDPAYEARATPLATRPKHSLMSVGICSSVETCSAAPRAIASRGMPKTTHEASSWAMVSAPAWRSASNPSAPSEPMPVSNAATIGTPSNFASERGTARPQPAVDDEAAVRRGALSSS